MRDLELASTTDLLEEIDKRMDCFVFFGYQNRSKTTYAIVMETNGSAPEMLGMTEMLSMRVRNMITNSEERDGGEEK